MCGITGILRVSSESCSGDLYSSVTKMVNSLSHRGPDDIGFWGELQSGLMVGQRRLSIVDLSSSGHQPMISASGRYVIALNGEIYNHRDMRSQINSLIAGKAWRGYSDTETLLESLDYWGLEGGLSRATGMFAFALWDKNNKSLYLARDRFGEKPLYYGWCKGFFLFGSELKSLRAFPGFVNRVCRQALADYVRFSYVPAPRSIYDGIYKLEPGCLLKVGGQPPSGPPTEPLCPGQSYGSIELSRWFSMPNLIREARMKLFTTEAAGIEQLEEGLGSAVSLQSQSDVPLGAFLSGGVDSSAIVALMQSQSSQRVRTFTIGFDEVDFDESPHARAVAKHLATDHHEMRVTSKMAQDVIPSLPWMYDEPFADSSQIPTHLVCKAAKQNVTVALSGDGGDELFGGYNRYFWGPLVWNRLSWLPLLVRRLMGHAIQGVPIDAWDRADGITGVSRLGDKVHRLGARLSSVKGMDDLFWSLVSEWDPALVVRGVGQVSRSPWESNNALPEGLNPVERMMFRDTVTYLPDDILCKVDRAAMACSLETRVPFLDHRVVEIAWRLPLNMKIRGNIGKWALRQVLYKYVPKELIERPKAGFAIPIGQWLRGPLRDWAESLLEESRLRQEGYFHPEPIRKAWAEHLAGRRDHTPKIWIILMFQAWLEDQSRTHTQKMVPQ
jgi:asparagine synthase (glutamine-hydrolysing)